MKQTIKIMIADDHQMFIDGVKALLSDVSDIEVIGEATNGLLLLEKLKTLTPDIILMDIGMPQLNGIETTNQVVTQFSSAIKIIALTMYDDNHRVVKMLKAGAKGYVLKNATKQELITAINTVADGGVHYSAQAIINTVQSVTNKYENPLGKLTDREIEIIKFILKSLTNKEIAQTLNISELTVNTHRKNAMRKLEIKNTAGLVKFAIDNDLANL